MMCAVKEILKGVQRRALSGYMLSLERGAQESSPLCNFEESEAGRAEQVADLCSGTEGMVYLT